MSWSVANGSSHSQTGPTRAEITAIPTQPYTHRNREATAAGDEPPANPWSMIHDQPASPRTRSTSRRTRGTATTRVSAVGTARMSRARMNRNESATVVAAPTR